MRVIAGEFGGRRLRTASGLDVRPTSDRVREALFSALGDLGGVRALDLYAGSGALGIEALSRGAASAVFVERAGGALRVLESNLDGLGLLGAPSVRVLRQDAVKALAALGRAGERFDLVFLDPPYAADALERALEALVSEKVLDPGAEVVVETSRRHALGPVVGLVSHAERRYGDTQIIRLHVVDLDNGAEMTPEGAPRGPDGA